MKSLEPKLMEPFIRATIACFETMMDIVPVHKSVSIALPPIMLSDICGIIGLSGDAKGTVSISFKEDVAMKVVGRFIEEEITEVDKDVYDAIGEIVNIIAGDAKSTLGDLSLSISLPAIMSGEKLNMTIPDDISFVNIIFELPELGEFTLMVGLEKS